MNLFFVCKKVSSDDNIRAELVNGTNEIQTYYGDKLDEETMKELERNASILGSSVLDNAKNAKVAVDSSFQNATWSERVWNNQTLLKNSLSNIISNALIQGKNPRDFISQIRKQFDVSRYQAERLLRTEIARAQVQAQAESYTAEDIEEYKYVACGLTDCCKVCKALDGKVFKVKDMEPGENAPPMHPNCHCATAPYLDRKEFDEWLNGYKDHGLTFEEWKKDNLQFKPKDKFYEKMFQELRDLGVEYKPVNYKQVETIDEIVKKIAGGDKTVGSCASAGLACMGRLIGLDVFDFRGGKSQKYFSRGDALYYLSQTEDMKSIQAKGACSMTVGNRLVKKMESGKTYYLCVGRHASIVRKINDDDIQYLELQSGYKNYPNGWYRFDKNIKNTLKTRFGCSNSKNVFSEQFDFMIDLQESNFDTENFRHLLGYINTNEQEQKKGKDGQIR